MSISELASGAVEEYLERLPLIELMMKGAGRISCKPSFGIKFMKNQHEMKHMKAFLNAIEDDAKSKGYTTTGKIMSVGKEWNVMFSLSKE